MSRASSRPSSIAGRKSFSKTARLLSDSQTRSDKAPEQQRIASLERKLQRKNEILAELMHEHLALRTGLASR
jgi:hypothetical protein